VVPVRKVDCVITSPLGLHARPAGLIVRECGRFASNVTVVCGDRKADGKKIFALLGLGVKQGDLLSFRVVGEDEEVAANALEALAQDF